MGSKLARFCITLAFVLASASGALAATPRTDSKTMAYHDGFVMTGTQDTYFVWYGCWAQSGCGGANGQYNDQATVDILNDFMSRLGGSPYFQINAGYPNANGQHPSGGLIFGGGAVDRYSRGTTLTGADLAGIVADRIVTGDLPQDPTGLYVVLTSSDVTVEDGATQFCVTCCNFHGKGYALGIPFEYAFVGNPARCPNGCASQFEGAASPNANFAADAMASWIAHALSGMVTDPWGTGWYDRYGLENSEKCEGTFGATQTVTNPAGQPAEFNITLYGNHYLLQQNWVNSPKKGHCAMDSSQ
jgi:hypothetical protein